MSYSNQIITEAKHGKKKVEIHLVQGKSLRGDPTFAYLAIYSHKVKDFKLSLMRNNTDLEKYGVVLESGFGAPPPDMQENILRTYLSDTTDQPENE